jgi:hypothetical protein
LNPELGTDIDEERAMGMVKRAASVVALGVLLVACGRSNPTATPQPTATATVAPTATATVPPTTAARPGGTPGTPGTPGGTPVANPAAVSAAYANLAKLDSYHMEIVVTDIGNLIQFGLGNRLSYSIDYNKGDQRIVFDDGSGTKQEAYKVGGKFYTVTNGAKLEVTSLPLQFTLPDLLYSSLTAQGAMTFTAAGSEQVNGRATTKYNGTGTLARLATNPLLALALAGASGDVAGPVWIDTREEFLVAGEIAVNVTAPRTGTTKLRMDVTQVNGVGPIRVP